MATTSVVRMFLLGGALALCVSTAARADVEVVSTVEGLRQCLQAAGRTECHIVPSQSFYLVVQPLYVTSPTIQVIKGLGVTADDTTLARATTAMQNIMVVQVANVTITNLRFHGMTPCAFGSRCAVPEGFADPLLTAANTTIDHVHFTRAPHFALQLGPATPEVRYSTFDFSNDGGIYADLQSGRFNVHNNWFHYNGGGAAAVYTRASADQPAYFRENEVLFNHLYQQDNQAGGQVMLGGEAGAETQQSAYIHVVDNFFDGGSQYGWGEYGMWIYGLEVYGRGHYFSGNYIRYQTGPGMHCVGLRDSQIAGGQNWWEIRENHMDGIAILNMPGYPYSGNVVMTGVRSNYNDWNGVKVDPRNYGTIAGVVVQYAYGGELIGNSYDAVCNSGQPGAVSAYVPVQEPCRM